MKRRSHKGVVANREHLPYCPNLGEHHMNWEGRHYRTSAEKRLRNDGAFLLPLFTAPAPNHTLIHRSMGETPIPSQADIYDMLAVANDGGLYDVLNQIDNRTTDHYRKQLGIAAMNPEEAIGRLFKKMYVTEREMRGW